MKTYHLICMFLVATVAMGHAGFKVSRSTYRMQDLDKAKAEAQEKGKGIIIICSDPAYNG